MVFAALYDFGLGSNVGADKLSRFFERLRIDTHIGISANSLRKVMRQMEHLLIEFQQNSEAQAVHESGKMRGITATADETFFGDLLMLVFMDLSSGYLLTEDIADNRCFDTWLQAVQPRLSSLNVEVEHLITDRAKPLIKLATDGLGCESGADLFHAQQDLSKQLGRSLKRLSKQVNKQIKNAWDELGKLFQNTPDNPDIDEQADKIKKLNQSKAWLKRDNKIYDTCIKTLSLMVHPFHIKTQQQQSSQDVESILETEMDKLEQIENQQLPDNQNKASKKFRKQTSAIVKSIDVWWYFVLNSLSSLELSTEKQNWMLNCLLPTVYWHQQMNKTKTPKLRECYKVAWEQASNDCQQHSLTHHLTASELEKHLQWATWTVGHFHRSSSAIEGRNGTLSQMYHNRRGLTPSRLKALTVLANYEQRGLDGKTSAERFFDTSFPDMFEWVLAQMPVLPLPRKRSKMRDCKSLNLQIVPP